MSIFDTLIGVIAPHACSGCGEEGRALCAACVAALVPVPSRCYRCGRVAADFRTCPACRRRSPLYAAWVVTAYNGTAKEVVGKLKFARARAAGHDVGDALAKRLPARGAFDVVAYVPTAPSRVRSRGYDQAELIARRVAQQQGLPLLSLLRRHGNRRQLGQTRAVRKTQMQGIFWAIRVKEFRGKHVLLVDDVLTTGSTCEAAAATLKAAGAKRVSAAVFAAA